MHLAKDQVLVELAAQPFGDEIVPYLCHDPFLSGSYPIQDPSCTQTDAGRIDQEEIRWESTQNGPDIREPGVPTNESGGDEGVRVGMVFSCSRAIDL